MNQNKATPPKPSKIVRKLKLSKQTLVPLTGEAGPIGCTRRATGCPVHTC